MTTKDLSSKEFGEYYQGYVDKVPSELSLVDAYNKANLYIPDFFDTIPSEKLTYRYDVGKWSIKEVYQHLIDTERVFAHRMFRIGRNDLTPLPGFDQDIYINPSGADQKPLEALHHEYKTTRANTAVILKSFPYGNLHITGEASGFPLSPVGAAFIILGHELWHKEILEERYI